MKITNGSKLTIAGFVGFAIILALSGFMYLWWEKSQVKYDEKGKWIRCPEIHVTGKNAHRTECWWLAEPKELKKPEEPKESEEPVSPRYLLKNCSWWENPTEFEKPKGFEDANIACETPDEHEAHDPFTCFLYCHAWDEDKGFLFCRNYKDQMVCRDWNYPEGRDEKKNQ